MRDSFEDEYGTKGSSGFGCLAATVEIGTDVPECAAKGPFGLIREFEDFTPGRLTHFVRRCCDATLASVPAGPQAVIGCFGLVCRGTQRGLMHPGKQQTSGCNGCYELPLW